MRRTALISLSVLGGCFWAETLRPFAASSSSWYDVGPVRKPQEEIVRAVQLYLGRAGYHFPPFDPGTGTFETEWDTHLVSHWREGFRTKVEVAFEDQGDGSTLVRIRSYREYNDESRFPMVEEKAKWVGASVEEKHAKLTPEPAIKLQQQLKVRFFGLGHE